MPVGDNARDARTIAFTKNNVALTWKYTYASPLCLFPSRASVRVRSDVTSSLCRWLHLFRPQRWVVLLSNGKKNNPIGRLGRTPTLIQSSVGFKKQGDTSCSHLFMLVFKLPDFWRDKMKTITDIFFGNKEPGDCSEGWYCAVYQTLRMPVTVRPSFVQVIWTKARHQEH